MAPLLLAAWLAATPLPKAAGATDRDGYPLPAGATARLGTLTLRGPTTEGLTFSADGKTLLAADGDRIYLWDAETGRRLPDRPAKPIGTDARIFKSLLAGPRLVRLARRPGPPGQWQEVLVTSVADGKQQLRFDTGPLQLGSAAVSPDGLYLAAVDHRGVAVYDLRTGKLLRTHAVEKTFGLDLSISPDGLTLFASDPDRPLVRRWALPNGAELPALKPDGGRVSLIAVSADGKRAVTRGQVPSKGPDGRFIALTDETFLTLWDLDAGRPTGRLEVGARPWHVRFAGPDALIVGTLVVEAPGLWTTALSRWDLARGRKVWEVPAPSAFAWIAVSPDGRRFAVSNRQHVLHLFDAATGKPLVSPAAHAGHVVHAAFSADGKTVTTIDWAEARTWAADGTPLAAAPVRELRRGAFRVVSRGDRFAWITRREDKSPEVVVWDDDKRAVGWRLPWSGGPVERVLTHGGSDRLVVVARDGDAGQTWTAFVYDGPTGKRLHEWPITDPPGAGGGWCPNVVLSPRGTLLHVMGRKVVERRLTDGEAVLELGIPALARSSDGVPPVAVSRDGTRVAVIEGQTVWVTDLKAGRHLVKDRLEGRVHPHRPVFSGDGRRLAVPVGGAGVRVYDLGAGREPRVLDGGTVGATSAAFSPGGARLVVGYADGTALIWDVAGG